MHIPINATVECTDGDCGRSTHVIIHPTLNEVTHIVVQESGIAGKERLVSIGLIVETTPERIRLSCSGQELAGMDAFVEHQHSPGSESYSKYAADDFLTWPYATSETAPSAEQKRVPHGEVAVKRGMRVVATDGQVGQVDELLMEPDTTEITHLILTTGHMWGKREVCIPIAEIDRIEEDTIYLKLDKSGVESKASPPEMRLRR